MKIREKLAPIKIEQCTLNKFFPNLPEPKNHSLLAELEGKETLSIDEEYTKRMQRDGTIYIKESHCLTCGSRLIKNGYNDRIAILDNGLGKHKFRIQRKRCPRCGEIKPDYSKIAPRYGNYHENYKRRARQHYMEGLMPPQIQRVFRIDFGIEISLTTLVNWINEVAEPLRKTLKETPVPSSGYWGYDEIHLRISKERMYVIDTVDINTRFVPVAKISETMGRDAGRKVLLEGRRGRNLWINGLVFENEKMNFDDELVKKVKKMRDMIFHRGFNPDDIESKINGNPKDVLMRFIFTFYEKILRFSGIIDEFAKSYGDQLLFHNIYEEKEKLKEEIDKIIIADRDISNRNVLKEIETIHTQLEDIGEKEIDVQFNWRTIEQDLTMNINEDLTKVYLPQGFPKEYFNFLVQNNRIPIDSEERRYDIEYPSLIYELNDLTIIFKVFSISNKTGDIKKIILEE